MPVRIKKGSSRLTHAELVVVDGIEFWARPEIPDLPPASTDTYHTIEDAVRIDMLARLKYRRQDWWWLLAHRNDMRVLPSEMTPAQTMVIPAATAIRKEIF